MSDDRSAPDDARRPDEPEPPLPPHLNPRRGMPPRRAGRTSAGAGAPPSRADRTGPDRTGPNRSAAGPRAERRRAAAVAGARHSRRAAPRRRPWAGLLKVLAATTSVLVLLSTGVAWAYYRDFNGQVSRIDVQAHGSGAGTHDIDGTDQNILLVGNDSRAGLTPEQLKLVGTTATAGLNTDTILLLHLPANGKKATVISFPRDSYVHIPGFEDNRINAAYADGACSNGCGSTLTPQQKSAGADELIKTVSNLTGVRIDHYAEVSLLGFYTISDVIGGVDVCLAKPAYDPGYTNLNLSAGHHVLKGTQALLFVRQRHHLARGDLDRIVRQQVFLSAMLRKVLAANTLVNPLKLHRLISAVAKSLTFDQSLDPLKLADQMRNVAAGNVSFSTIPTQGPATIEGKDVLAVDPAKVQEYIDHMIATTDGTPSPAAAHSSAPTRSTAASSAPAPTVTPDRVDVEVYNGTTTQGLAGRTATALTSAGYHVAGTGNADRSDYGTTEIRYGPTQAAAAHTLARVVPNATMQQVGSLGSTVNLVLGTNFSGLKSPDSSSSTPTSPATRTPSGSASPKSDTTTRTAADTGCID